VIRSIVHFVRPYPLAGPSSKRLALYEYWRRRPQSCLLVAAAMARGYGEF
jgi:hypothetical protein